MKNLIKNTIISQVIALGFDFEQFSAETELREVEEAMIDFFNENSEKLERVEDECNVQTSGRSQYVIYCDYRTDGDIVDFSENWHKSPKTKVFHTNFLMEKDNLIKNMYLYYLVGKTEHN